MLFLCACKCLFILLCWFLLITNLPVQSLYIKYSFVLYRVSIHLRKWPKCIKTCVVCVTENYSFKIRTQQKNAKNIIKNWDYNDLFSYLIWHSDKLIMLWETVNGTETEINLLNLKSNSSKINSFVQIVNKVNEIE